MNTITTNKIAGRAFTLVEVLVVILIITIMFFVAIPTGPKNDGRTRNGPKVVNVGKVTDFRQGHTFQGTNYWIGEFVSQGEGGKWIFAADGSMTNLVATIRTGFVSGLTISLESRRFRPGTELAISNEWKEPVREIALDARIVEH